MLSLKDWSSIDFQLNKNRSVVLSLSSNGCNVCVAVNAKLLEVEKKLSGCDVHHCETGRRS